MAKYYAITIGEYSRRVIHITSDKKLAEAYVKLNANKDYDYDSEYMHIEEYDDLIDQCDIQDMFDKAGVLHPYLKIYVTAGGRIYDNDHIKHCLETKDAENFIWKDHNGEETKFNEYSVRLNFGMSVQVDKYNYDYDKIIKVVMDTRAKMLAEKDNS